MPELPEVETVRKGLNKLVRGKEIQSVEVRWPKIIERPAAEEFVHELIGEIIEDVQRRGKYLIFKLTHYDMVCHLRMEGKFDFHADQKDEITKHTHVLFTFSDGSELLYLDVRKFGRFTLLEKNEAVHYKGIQKLGPEPVEPDFDLTTFSKKLKRHSKAIKPLLLDQTLVTGLGNIYVDEALFRAKIHPETPADELSEAQIKELHQDIIDVLARAVEAGGTTIRTYKNALGNAGTFQVKLVVYGKEGTPCPRCGTEIFKIKVAQRGTHFCPNCQKPIIKK
ncbi:DNA-formamidopyrimidine glycosylase [Vagococcus vulneris]|uniref:Formamidopyrimidine-DNA glycosylase n=1 Tax=Vagococcus vulneris TaxID=1977869 RepID=A0A430A261_9ENTE|nr:DNA-formamidopyrimidine glycosylase [Vagococcus vulneris]RSU00531.1 DNA-formamidopyrimidine glycosylase [Vagococcus vulneris]